MLKNIAMLNSILFFCFASYCMASDIDYSGKKPEEILKNKGGGPVQRIITRENTPVSKSGKSLKEIAKAKFLSHYFVAKESGSTDEDFSLLVEDVNEDDKPITFLGWVQNKYLLKRTEAIRNELDILRKILVINKWELAKKKGDSLVGAILRKGPGEEFEKNKESSIFRFYYLYKELEVDGKTWYLVGPQPTVYSYDKSVIDVSIYGWITEEKVFRWETREAIQYNKKSLDVTDRRRKTPVRIYLNYKELEEVYLDGEDINPLVEETIPGQKMEYSWMRFPLLDAVPFPKKYKITEKTISALKALKFDTKLLEENLLNEEFTDEKTFLKVVESKVDNFTKAKQKQILENSEYGEYMALKIGYIGDQISVSGEDVKFRNTEGDTNKQKVNQIVDEAQTLDILFVVDATGSMKSYFSATSKGIYDVIKKIKSELVSRQFNPTLRFSVLFYRDYQDEATTDSFLDKRNELKSNNDNETISFIEEMDSHGGGDKPEAVFYALHEQLVQSQYKEGSFRTLIHIADASNHVKDEREYNAKQVGDKLKEKNIDLVVGINVSGNPSLTKNMEEYTQSMSDDNKRIYSSVSVSDVKDKIVEIILDTTRDSKATMDIARDIKEGKNVTKVGSKYGNRLTARFVERMKAKGIDPAWFNTDKIQIFDEGWILGTDRESGRSFTEHMLLLNRTDVEKIIAFMNALLRTPVVPKTIAEIWKKQLESEIGEEIKTEEKVSAYMTKILGIPIRSNLLKYSLDELAKLTSTQIAELQANLVKLKDNLRDINIERKTKINEAGVPVKLGTVIRFWGEGKDQNIWMHKNELP